MLAHSKFKFCFLEFLEFFLIFLIWGWLNPQMWNPQIQTADFTIISFCKWDYWVSEKMRNLFKASQLLSYERNLSSSLSDSKHCPISTIFHPLICDLSNISHSYKHTLKNWPHAGSLRRIILGWPKSSFGFVHKMVWKNLNELFSQI